MFKRLQTKSRRHSADEVGNTSSQSIRNEPLGIFLLSKKSLEVQDDVLNRRVIHDAKFKQYRKSIGDEATLHTMLPTTDDYGFNHPHQTETGYQTVTAVPAFIVEHEAEKKKGLSVWGRRMSKKIESFRRIGSRESLYGFKKKDGVIEGSNDSINIINIDHNNSDNNNNKNNKHHYGNVNNNIKIDKNHNNQNNNYNDNGVNSNGNLDHEPTEKSSESWRVCSKQFMRRAPSPFKSFFVRMGSTGMLNTSRINRKSQNMEQKYNSVEKDNLFRSCSTSQLNTSPTYVKGDDPSEGIDLQVTDCKDKTMSCDNLVHENDDDDDIFEDTLLNFSMSDASSSGFDNFNVRTNDILRKSSSCDFKDSKRSSFPYAFLRSKLSVLPEERHNLTFTKANGLFKTTSEEHLSVIHNNESLDEFTKFDKRCRKIENGRVFEKIQENSCLEYGVDNVYHNRDNKNDEEQCKYNLNRLNDNNNVTLQEDQFYDHVDDKKHDFSVTNTNDLVSVKKNYRRNSAPCAEQKFSSHYISSNESGYDSDGPGRGEIIVSFDHELVNTKYDGSDTSSVLDLENEKTIRYLKYGEHKNLMFATEDSANEHGSNNDETEMTDNIHSLSWHQSRSGRFLPSIHQSSCSINSPNACPLFYTEDHYSVQNESQLSVVAPHRFKLQQDKARFLSNIIQSVKKVKRRRVIELCRKDNRENLGIHLAQQNLDELKYIIVQLDNDGIAHRDGRLRLGDEIVEVEGRELKSLKNLNEVQKFLKSFTGYNLHLIAVYEEIVPQNYTDTISAIEHPNNQFNNGHVENQKQRDFSGQKISELCKNVDYLRTSFDRLPSMCIGNNKQNLNDCIQSSDNQLFITKHTAKFEKGIGKPSLGFSVVGGKDSPRGDMGIFVRRIFPGGQADISKVLLQGDEILALNGKQLRGCTHQEVIDLFKSVREGVVTLELARKHRYPKNMQK